MRSYLKEVSLKANLITAVTLFLCVAPSYGATMDAGKYVIITPGTDLPYIASANVSKDENGYVVKVGSSESMVTQHGDSFAFTFVSNSDGKHTVESFYIDGEERGTLTGTMTTVVNGKHHGEFRIWIHSIDSLLIQDGK